ncbi:WD40/YVTN/BNR-like repeat-containing protein [Candidatus Palauibacter sp.]|uniref:WD40/YVTN/BNR-like repeat-containing protein n=1 Tax=Candidatus Palauibacter sp. TaxID=3101350 RepID=UPI003AF219ED
MRKQDVLTLATLTPLVAVSLVLAASTPALAAQEAVVFDSADVAGLSFRSIGPPRGGRSTAVAGITEQPLTYFMGGTGSGVWRTDDAGLNWRNISDGYMETGSIGAIDVADGDPNVIYVGTGSACIRGNVSKGIGVYRSTDGGDSWTHVGLPNAGQIGRIEVHPRDPDIAFVAAMGDPFGFNPERGVFRTTDGGETWDHVLAISDSTGVVDLAMNPGNPRIIFAAAWRGERKPWTAISGSEESGIFRSTDGGDTWDRLEGGLPTGLVGKAAITVSRANPDRVWVLIEAPNDRGGVYRSDDGGDSWRRVNDDRGLQQRAWYYTHIYADPVDENTVYALNVGYNKSIDGGVTWQSYGVPHGDVHDLWINYENPDFQVVANDGGGQVTTTGAESWSTYYNQNTAEMYRVFVDDQFPYRVYGSQQDNSTIMVPSRGMPAVQPAQHWSAVGGCESGHIAIDPRNPNVTYAGCYGGSINRVDRETGDVRQMLLYPQLQLGHAAKMMRHRFQWNAPIRLSPHDPDVVYHASQFVNRTRDAGYSWETISPDLTRNDTTKQDFAGGRITWDNTGVEVYGTIFAFEESPHEAGVLWAGSDDGLIHVSRDDGANWADVTPGDLPEFSTVNMIDLSAHGPGRAHVAVYRYRMADDTPYMWRTDDYGESWTRLSTNGIEPGHFVRVVREDPEREGLLYAGTEYGLYLSFDAGDSWQRFQQNLPITPITDMRVHEGDLVVATQGRSFWILDDVSPLRTMSAASLAADVHLYAPGDAVRAQGVFPNGAVIHFALGDGFGDGMEETVNVEIAGGGGDVVRVYSSNPGSWDDEAKAAVGRSSSWSPDRLQTSAGLNRAVWNLQGEGPDLVQGARIWGFTGRVPAVPGSYEVRLSAGDATQTQPLAVHIDPRVVDQVTVADLQAQHDLMVRVRGLLQQSHDAVRDARSIRSQMSDIAQSVEEAGYGDDFTEMADETGEKLTDVEEELFQTQNRAGQDPLNFPPMLDNEIANLYGYISSTYDRPNQVAGTRADELEAELGEWLGTLQQIIDTDVAAFNNRLREAGVPGVIVRTPPRATS